MERSNQLSNEIIEKYTVQERLVDYWWLIDQTDAMQAADFYTEDCVYQMLSHRWEGHEPILDYYKFRNARGARLIRHLMSNVRVTLHGPDVATVKAALSVYAADGVPVLPAAAPIMVADEECEFVKCQDGVWRMRKHVITAMFKGGSNEQLLEPPTK
ncbi:nuclear transport factor 2 family protein [Bordetella sp. 15P40C-2]|uniref:nuclear transport factor 2 family protein n=1 Tax=Bordetella sp. 15P40C-2 TaxID=2572246 RepID=UPI001326B3EC|nr:hypothetical protein [Bordetella sp. 15P40C-2]